MSFKIDVDLAGLDRYMNELADNADAAARPAAQAAIQVVYDQIRLNVAAMGRKSGNLERSIYQAYATKEATPGRAIYQAGWNHKKAPHAHLLEWGWLQRYVYRPDGMGPMVRPGMDGREKPGRRASQAEKNAYYVPLAVPKQIPGRAFVRRAESAFERAYQAAEQELLRRIKGGGEHGSGG